VLGDHLLLDCGRVLVRPRCTTPSTAGSMRRAPMRYWFATRCPVRRRWAHGGLNSSPPAARSPWKATASSASTCWGRAMAQPGLVARSRNGRRLRPDFPLVSIRDNVRAQARLIDSLGIKKLRPCPRRIDRRYASVGMGNLRAGACRARCHHRCSSALGHGYRLNHLQRTAIQQDPSGQTGIIFPSISPAWFGPGAANRHVELQVGAALRTSGSAATPIATAKIRAVSTTRVAD